MLLLIMSVTLLLLPQIGSDLSDGTRLVYSSGGALQDPWIYDSVRVTARDGFDRCVVVARRGQAARESCVRGDTLFERVSSGAHAAARPLGAAMTLDISTSNGNVVRYVTEPTSVARVQTESIEYVPTTITTRNADGRVIRRLREHYAPTLLTAIWGVFEEPDSAGGWRTVRAFSLAEIHRPEPPPRPAPSRS